VGTQKPQTKTKSPHHHHNPNHQGNHKGLPLRSTINKNTTLKSHPIENNDPIRRGALYGYPWQHDTNQITPSSQSKPLGQPQGIAPTKCYYIHQLDYYNF